jgi:hypothetical protein
MSILNSLIERVMDRAIEKTITDRREAFLEEIHRSGDPASRSGEASSLKAFRKRKSLDRMVIDFTKQQRPGLVRITSTYKLLRSPYHYDRIDRFFSKESYFARSLFRQLETLMRNGFSLMTDQANIRRIIRRDLTRIHKNSKTSDQMFFARVFLDLTRYSIVFIQKIRETRKTEQDGEIVDTGRIKRLRIIPPHSVIAHFDKNGTFLGITENSISPVPFFGNRFSRILGQMPNSNPTINANDLIVIRLYQDDGQFFPEPQSFQVLDDVLTLRSIEETAELLINQFGSPILHTQVGTEAEPAMQGEVDTVHSTIENMATNGMITTDHRVNIKPVSLLAEIGNISPYIEHFKARILMGVGSSTISVGEGDTSNRNTASSIDDAMADRCIYIGNCISSQINHDLFIDILNTHNITEDQMYDTDGELVVRLKFNEMRTAQLTAIENSASQRFLDNLITRTEARKIMGHAPLSDAEEGDTYLNKVQVPLAMSKPATTGGDSQQNLRTSQNSPSNQHGKKPSPGSTKN